MTAGIRSYTVAVYSSDREEGYWAEVLDLPGCVAQGKTLKELKEAVQDAIDAWEETWKEISAEQGVPEPYRRRVETMRILVDDRDSDLVPA